MKKLLVPVDKSETAMRALSYAIRLAKENGQIEIHIVNAHDLPVIFNEIGAQGDFQRAMELQKEHGEQSLKPAIGMLTGENLPYKSAVLVGDVAHEIVQYAEQHGCDGIVMGTRGMGAVGNLLMGSVATKVVHLTKLPVTLIK